MLGSEHNASDLDAAHAYVGEGATMAAGGKGKSASPAHASDAEFDGGRADATEPESDVGSADWFGRTSG